LKQIRRKQGLSRAEVARSAGLTRRELGAYERGSVDVPESDLWCLAGSCGVDVSELLPARDPLNVSSDLSSLAVGDSIRHLRGPVEPDGLLREYLSMIYELRNLPPGSRVPLREPDLMALADALGGSPDAIEQKLIELIGASREEAARLRAMILPPLSLPAAFEAAPSSDPYATLGTSGSNDVVDFFSAPRAEDPFSPPPPLTPAAPLSAESFDILPADPFAPPPSSEPVAAGPAPEDPALVPPLVDPFAPPDPDLTVPLTADAPPVELVAPAPAVEPPPAATPWGESFASWGSDRALPEGLVVDHGVPDAPATPADPFAAPVSPGSDETAYEPYVSTPDAFAASNGNGHHDVSGIVDADPAPVDELEPIERAELLDGFVSDTPLLAEGTLLDEPALDDVINEMVGGIVADPDPGPDPDPDSEPDPGPEPEPASQSELADAPIDVEATPVAAVDLTEPAVDDAFVLDASPVLPDDDVTPISWIAQDEPVAPVAPAPRFEQVGANWRLGGSVAAAAAADDGALAIRRADARWAVADIDAPADFTIDATVDFTAGTGFGILFRASVDEAERISGYSFDVDTVAAGGGYLLRQWEDSRQHWRPLAHAPVADPSMLYGKRAVQVTLHGDHLNVIVDGDTVLSVPGLSRASVGLARTPCRGHAVGVQASATTELTVDTFRIAR
jgi:transcriptional regulator with XRE-family HTH domain